MPALETRALLLALKWRTRAVTGSQQAHCVQSKLHLGANGPRRTPDSFDHRSSNIVAKNIRLPRTQVVAQACSHNICTLAK